MASILNKQYLLDKKMLGLIRAESIRLKVNKYNDRLTKKDKMQNVRE